MKKNSFVLLIIGIVLFVLALLLILGAFIYNNRAIVLKDSYEKIEIKVSSKKDKIIKLNLDKKSNIIIEDIYVSSVKNNYVYVLKDENNKNISTGILLNKEGAILRNIAKGKYKLYISNNNIKKQKVKFRIKREDVKNEDVALLEEGYHINDKILEFAGKDYKDWYNTTIKRIKIADKMNDKYKDASHLVSDKDSKEDIYLWVEGDTVYFYSNKKIAFGEYADDVFSDLNSLIDVNDLKYFDFSNAVYMGHFFFNDSSLSDIKAISYIDTSNVKSVGGMFYGCYSLTDITPFISFANAELTDVDSLFYDTVVSDISILKYFDVSKIENFSGMFEYTKVVDISPLRDWNTKSAKSLSGMFSGTRIENVDDLSKWNVSKVKSMIGLFDQCVYLKNINGLKKWDTSSLEHIDYAFSYNTFKDLDILKNFKTDRLTSISGAFSNMRNLKDISGIKDWNVSKVKQFDELFELTGIEDTKSLEKWDVSNAEQMNEMFSHTKIKNLDGLKNWDVSKVTDFREMFNNTQLTNLKGISKWDVSSGEKFDAMFVNNSKLKDSTGIDNWKVVGSTKDMFHSTNTKLPKWYS